MKDSINIPETYLSAKLSKGNVEIVKKSFPQFDDNTVVIKIYLSGICRADAKEVNNSRDISKYLGPLFGHELNGEIVYAGKETGFKLNQTVAFNPNATNNRTAGFAEYMIIKDSKEVLKRAIIPIPGGIPLKKSIFAEPFACIVHSLNKFQCNTEKSIKSLKIAIIGAGNAGMAFGLLAKQRGANVKLFNVDDGRIEFAKKRKLFDGQELHLLSEHEHFEKFFDVVIIATTIIMEEILKIAFRLVSGNGYLLLYGGTRKNDRFLDTDVDIDTIRKNEVIKRITYKNKKIFLSGAYGCNVEDFVKGFKLLKTYSLHFPLDRFISKEIEFKDFPKLIMDMASGNIDYAGKVIVRY